MFSSISVITDCSDSNATLRQSIRYNSLFPGIPTHIIPVIHDLQAGWYLLDALDASLDREQAIIVNLAPRDGRGKKWENGTPFGYTRIGDTLVIASVDGYTLSGLKKLGILDDFHLFDIPTVMHWAQSHNLIETEKANMVIETQFRSYEFLPRILSWITQFENDIPTTKYPISEITDAPYGVWCIDNFGNIKTTLLSSDPLPSRFPDIQKYQTLHEVPSGAIATTIGSSGYGRNRFREYVINGGSFATVFDISIGEILS